MKKELPTSQKALEEQPAGDGLVDQLKGELLTVQGALQEARASQEGLRAELNSAAEQMAAYLEYHERNVDLLADSPSLAALQARLASLEQMGRRVLALEEMVAHTNQLAKQLEDKVTQTTELATKILDSRIWRTLVHGGRFFEYFLPATRRKS